MQEVIAVAAGAGIELLELIDGSTQGDISLSHTSATWPKVNFAWSFESPGRRYLIKENAPLHIFSSRAR